MTNSPKIHFEDLVVGTVETCGGYQVTRDEVIGFATNYDPQPFHVDDEAAAASIFGKIAASGMHTLAMTMRMMVDNRAGRYASIGGGGIDKLRWTAPVYPGDTLSVRSTLVDKRRIRSRPERGMAVMRQETMNQHGKVVMTYEVSAFFAVRDPSAPFED